MRDFLILFIACFLGSCSGNTLTGYGFETHAQYAAVKSDLIINITATGHVLPGQDTGNGETHCTVVSRQTGDEIIVDTRNGCIKEVTVRGERFDIKDSLNLAESLLMIFKSLGISTDTNEITESEAVIKGCESGPKGTFMKGQTQYLSVVKTEFSRN